RAAAHAEPGGEPANRLVLVNGPRPKLEHLTEHRPASPPNPRRVLATAGFAGCADRGQRFECGADRVRVRVVRIVDDGHAVRPVVHFHPPSAFLGWGGGGGPPRGALLCA